MTNNQNVVSDLQELLKEELHQINLSLKKEISFLNDDLSDKLNSQEIVGKELRKDIKKIDDKINNQEKDRKELKERIKNIDDSYKNIHGFLEEEVKMLEKKLRKIIKDGIEEEIGKLNKKMDNLKNYTLEREKDRDNSYRYLTRSHFSSVEKKSTLVDDGDAFLASPDEYVPEHPFSR